jgi:hypothetical protein
MIRPLQPGDDAAYRALWSEALARHGPHFRTAPRDLAPHGIPTVFTDDS